MSIRTYAAMLENHNSDHHYPSSLSIIIIPHHYHHQDHLRTNPRIMIGCLPLFTVRWPMNPKRIPPITFNWSNFNQNDCWKKKKSILNDDESIVMTCESLVTSDLCCGDYDATDSCQGFRWKLPGFKPGNAETCLQKKDFLFEAWNVYLASIFGDHGSVNVDTLHFGEANGWRKNPSPDGLDQTCH